MIKFHLPIITVLLVSILIFSGCDLDGDGDVNLLTLTGTITHTFGPGWVADYSASGNDYYLVEEENDATLDTDDGGDANLNLSYGVPAAVLLYPPSEYSYTSTNDSAEILTVRVQEENGDFISNGYYGDPYQWYTYLYSSHATVINGIFTDPDDSNTYTMDNVSVAAGWNWVKTSTINGSDFIYANGAISGPMWTSS